MMNKNIKQDLLALPCFKITGEGPTWIYGQCRNFYVRVFYEIDKKQYNVQFGVKKNFDRWANSSNFEFFVTYTGNYTQDFKKTYSWMMRVVKSNLFDFNCYFGTIPCAWYYRPL